MYYLLAGLYSKVWDERIVSDNELLEHYSEYESFCKLKLEVYKNPSDRLELRVKGIRENGSEFFISDKGLIKKQSENVWDLIENGDLLRITQEQGYVFKEYKGPEITNYAGYIKDAYPKDILAIYKPNPKGDYIKVWEEKK